MILRKWETREHVQPAGAEWRGDGTLAPSPWPFMFVSFMPEWPAPASPDRPQLAERQLEGASWTGQDTRNHLGDLLQAHYSFGFWGQSKWAQMALHPWSSVPRLLMPNPTSWNELIYSGLACANCIREYIISMHTCTGPCVVWPLWPLSATVSSRALVSKPERKLNVAGLERQSPGKWPGRHI